MNTSTLPRHPRTGARALGWRKARPGETGPRPIWPVLGGAENDEDGNDGGQDDEDDQDEDAGGDEGDGGAGDDAPLGAAGTKALAAEKERRRKEAERRRTAEARVAELEAAQGAGGEGQPTPEQIRAEATTKATAAANARILRSEVRAAASGKLADPRDALRFLDLDRFEVDADGQVDEAEIADAIEELLKTKPYLAAGAGRQRFEGTGDGGARKGAAGPRQLGADDVKKMTPEQIDAAHTKGQLRDYLGG